MNISMDSSVNISLDFYVHNIVFSQRGGVFTKDLIARELRKCGVRFTESQIDALLEKWLSKGIICNEITHYEVL